MTIEEAVLVLRQYRHNGHENWRLSGSTPYDMIVWGDDRYEWFSPFEAIAIAEKYVSISQSERAK